MRRVAIVGGGIAGLTATYELAKLARSGVPVEAVLFEASNRFGGLIETVREGGFTIEGGPDGWVSAKPWARELAIELGLESELIPSNDATRKTYIFLASPDNPSGRLVPMPDGFQMMVPSNLDALAGSPLFTDAAIAAYRAEPARAAELLAAIPDADESVADFTQRHFGPEVLARIAAPLLSGVFGGDVRRLSVRAVLPAFVQMEREHGSLISALQFKFAHASTNNQGQSIFTTLRSGMGTLVDRLVAALPPQWLRLHTTVTSIRVASSHTTSTAASGSPRWTVHSTNSRKQQSSELFDAVLLALPLDTSRSLLAPLDADAAQLLPTESSSAVLVAFAYTDAARVPLPPGFGFLVPPNLAEDHGVTSNRGNALGYPKASALGFPADRSERGFSPWGMNPSLLLACTFIDQKFPHRVPPGGRLVRAFFGGPAVSRIARCNNDEIAAIAGLELARILHASSPVSDPAPTPLPAPVLTVVRRWPNSLPQYSVGHPDRVAQLESRLRALPGITLLGNSLNGLGIPDLIRAARAAARAAAATDQ